MSLTLEELKERLRALDETILIELLQLESDTLVERYEDIIINKFSDLEEQLEDKDYGQE
jgi:hypothetical protein